MAAPLQSWRQFRSKRPLVLRIVSIGIGLLVIIALIIVGYQFDWTGFGGYTQVTTAHTLSGPSIGTVIRTEVSQPGKALWDWLQLLIIPLVLAVGALLFNFATTRSEQKIALDRQREELFQKYLDCMSDLLLKENLRTSARDAEVRKFARVRTITLLFQLDARRISYVFAFLDDAELMSHKKGEESIVSFCDANLEKVNFSGANLRGANLEQANLEGANLSRANLQWANLSLADLEGADLSGAYFYESNLWGARLEGANLSRAFIGASLSHADLTSANLANAVFPGIGASSFDEADLSRANLRGARVLTNVKLEEALEKAKSLKGATMPDGSIHP